MADKIVATWTNDSVGITSQRVYRTLNEGTEVLIATLPPNQRSYVDTTFKDTDPFDASYRVTSVGTISGVETEETTNTLTVNIRRNITAMEIAATGPSLQLYSASPIVIEWADGSVSAGVPSAASPELYEIVKNFPSNTTEYLGSLYSADTGPIKALYAIAGLKRVFNWYSEGVIGHTLTNPAMILKPYTFPSILMEVPPTAPPGVTDLSRFFFGCTNFNQDLSGWDVSNVTNMREMFALCTYFNGNITNWNVSNVTDMSHMFDTAEWFNQDISGWNLANVTDMTYMFSNAYSFNQPIGSWVFPKVTSLQGFLQYAFSFNQPLNSWDVSKITNFNEFLQQTTGPGRTAAFNQPLNNWVTRGALTMSNMFSYCVAFNQDISMWNVGNVTQMSYMFYQCDAFIQDLSQWCVGQILSQPEGFGLMDAENYPVWGTCPLNNREYVDITGFPPNKLIGVGRTYQLGYNTNLVTPTASWSLNVDSSVATIDSNGLLTVLAPAASVEVTLVLNNDSFYTEKVNFVSKTPLTPFSIVYSTGGGAINLRVGPNVKVDWGDGSPVEWSASDNFYLAHTYPTVEGGTSYTLVIGDGLDKISFNALTGFTTVISWPGQGWNEMDVGNPALATVPNSIPPTVTSLNSLFSGATNFNQDISMWDVSNVTDFSYMFWNCFVYNQSLSAWDVSSATNMNYMFYNATSFNQVINNWCVTNITSLPTDFATGANLEPVNYPVWGTCPTPP